MTSRVPSLIEKYFGDWEHPYRRFEREVDARIGPGCTLLDIGCGRTAPVLQKYRRRGLNLIGIDCVEFPTSIEGVELHNADITSTALPSSTVDVAMARSVIEHVSDPLGAYREIYRILKPGGHFIFLTANFWDYASLIAHALPNRWHPKIVQIVEGREPEDVFPTMYRSNTRRKIHMLAQQSGLKVAQFEYLGQYPSYFMFSAPLFILATAYEKTLARFQCLHFLRGWIFAVLQRPADRIPLHNSRISSKD
jgi:SAM-dependent methyltransferase